MIRYKATFEAADGGVADYSVEEIGSGKKPKRFISQVNVPDAMSALISAFHGAAYYFARKHEEDEVRDRFILKIEVEGEKAECRTILTTLHDGGGLNRCEFNNHTVSVDESISLDERMVAALTEVKDWLADSLNDPPGIT
jgi:hypothetical protein